MKRLALLLVPWLAFAMKAGAAPSSPPAAGTNDLIIECDGGFEYLGPTAIYHVNVRATDPQMRLTCEQLTVTFHTNQTNQSKIERIVAESNVVITQQQGRATGDLAIYTAANDVVELMGNAMLETPQGKLRAAKIFFDRRNNKLSAPGRVFMELRPDAFGQPGISLLGTNSLRLPGAAPPTNAPPAALNRPTPAPAPAPRNRR